MNSINPISRHRGAPRPEGGFALLVALLAIVVLTAIATGGFLLANSENRTSANHLSTVEAFYLADAGLRDFLGSNVGVPPAQQSFTYDAGSAQVTTRTLRTGLGAKQNGELFQITSVGTFDQGGVSVSREVSSVALLQPFDLPQEGAVASGNGISKNGNSGTISGFDASESGECPGAPQDATAGVFVPTDGYEGKEDPLEGDPEIQESDDPLAEMDIDWEGIREGTALPHQYTIPDDDWADIQALGEDEWPVVYVDGDEELSGGFEGQGTLIVKDNLTLGGNVEWDGPIMVGGNLTDNGKGNIRGAVITGLNALPPYDEQVAEDDLDIDDTLNGTKRYEFHSCNLYNAMRGAAVFVDEPGTWHQIL